MYLSTPVFSHGQYYVGLSRAGSFEVVKVLVVDHEKQGLYEHNEGIPDGVYTDNVVWKEALLPKEHVETIQSPTMASTLRSQTVSTDNRETPLPEPPSDEQTSQTETMTEFIDEGSGAPATPRTSDVQQPLDRHGTDDTDEYGTAAAHASTSNVTIVGTDKGSVLDLAPTEDMVKPDEETQTSEPTPEDMVAFVDELKKRAQAAGMRGDSEWYGKKTTALAIVDLC